MATGQYKRIHKNLLDRREVLLSEMRAKNAEAARVIDEGVADTADQGLADSLREFLHLLGDSKRAELIEIDEALERLDAGEYGLCLDCQEAIAGERLELLPHSRYCLACQQGREEREALRKGPGAGTL